MNQQAKEHEERPHAERSASQLGALAKCPGYRPKPAARVHWVTAQGSRGHAALDAGDDGELHSEFEAGMVETCERYAAALPPASRQLEEMRVETIEGRWGYTDRLRIRADENGNDSNVADLLDWKFVRKDTVADAEINLQGKDYVVAILEDEQFSFLDTIHNHFVLPRLNTVSTATFTRADLPRLKLEILAVLARARATDAADYDGSTLRPVYGLCTYCGAAGNCVALRRIADGIARQYDPAGYGPSPAVPAETHASNVKDPAQRAQLQKLAGLMEGWSSSVRHHNLTAALSDSALVPAGYAVDWMKGKRRVLSPSDFRAVASRFGLTTDDLIASSNISWGKLEDILKFRAPRGQKGKAVELFGQALLAAGAVDPQQEVPRLIEA